MLSTLIASAAIALSTLAPTHLPTDHHVNGLRLCDSHVRVSCVARMDETTGRFVVRDSHGHAHHKRSGAAVLDYAQRKSVPCAQEDSSSCYWDAQRRGNGIGNSYVEVGGSFLWYLDIQE